MTSNIFQDIKDRVDLKDIVRYYGLEVDRGGFACCPFHNERNPSFKVYEDPVSYTHLDVYKRQGEFTLDVEQFSLDFTHYIRRDSISDVVNGVQSNRITIYGDDGAGKSLSLIHI